MIRHSLHAVLLATVLMQATGCDPCGFAPCDGEGYGVWVSNASSDEVLVRFGDEGERTYRVSPGTVDGKGPWMSLAADGASAPGVTVWTSDCGVLEQASLEPGEYRLHIDSAGGVALVGDDVPNDAGDALPEAGGTCD